MEIGTEGVQVSLTHSIVILVVFSTSSFPDFRFGASHLGLQPALVEGEPLVEVLGFRDTVCEYIAKPSMPSPALV